MIRLKKTWQALCLSSLTLLGAAVATPAVAADQFIAIPSFRVGPYGTNGQSFYGGFIDYLTYVNMKDGGVNGVKFSWEECETEYNTAKGVECYERLKANAGPSKGTALHVMSTGISYGVLEPKTTKYRSS
jgi:branched-chain amino acid transport system substrate-binding protein